MLAIILSLKAYDKFQWRCFINPSGKITNRCSGITVKANLYGTN